MALWDLHYNVLKDYVDEFIVCEATTTFSGKPKPLYYEKIKDRYKNVKYFIIPDEYTEDEKRLAEESPNTIGADHWKREFLQKESIKKALTHLDDEDIVYIGDCDEIWLFPLKPTAVWKLKLKVYTYYLDQRSTEEFWGTIVGKYKDIKDECLNHLRTNAIKGGADFGWHFTSMADDLRRKLGDSYTAETYANEWVTTNLAKHINNNEDFLGRDFRYWIDTSDWPEYLTNNKKKYRTLMKNMI